METKEVMECVNKNLLNNFAGIGVEKRERELKGPIASKNVFFSFTFFFTWGLLGLYMLDSHGNNLVDGERLMILKRADN